MDWFPAVASFFGKILDVAKSTLIFLFVRKSAQTEIRYEQLKKISKKQKKQLQIAATPRRSWDDLIERMRMGDGE